MKTFSDNQGRTWVITINVFAVKRCRALCGIDLFGLVDDSFQGLGKLLGDPCSLVDVLYVLCKDECEKQGVSDESFGRSMGGDSLEHAANAFLAELTDFFPDPRVRTGLQKLLEKSRVVRDLMVQRGLEQIDELDPDSVVQRLTDSSGNSRESSESIPVHLRSAS